jgi:hypothetical protein
VQVAATVVLGVVLVVLVVLEELANTTHHRCRRRRRRLEFAGVALHSSQQPATLQHHPHNHLTVRTQSESWQRRG